MPLPSTGSLITVHGGMGVVPSASSEPPDTSAPPDPTEGLSPPLSSSDPAPGGFIDFSGGLGTVAPAPPPDPDAPVNPPASGPPVFIGAPVTKSAAGAIFAFWVTRGDLYSQITGGLWTGEAPATVLALPYAVLTQVSDVLESRTTGPKIFRSTYQISVMATDLTDADSLCRQVSAAYDGARLVLDGFVSCLAGDVRWMLGTKSLGLLGEDCWTSYVELEIMYTR